MQEFLQLLVKCGKVRNFAIRSLHKLMKKGGGTGPVKPWQPPAGTGAKSDSGYTEKDKFKEVHSFLTSFDVVPNYEEY
jgi:hypothetical protein